MRSPGRGLHQTDATAIWPPPAVWVWLVANSLWLQLVVPVWIVSMDVIVTDPGATLVTRVLAAITMIVVIPFVGVIGIAVATLFALLGTERVVRRWRG